MKICVVGGTGNISTSIVKVLLEQNHEVVCFNRGLRGSLPDKVRLIKGDRFKTESFEEIIQKENFDAAIDMFCFNAFQAMSSIRAFRNVKHFIMCSTIATYGFDFNSFPTKEDHLIRPTDGYGHNKAEADAVFMEAYEKNAFPVTIIKPTTVYGPKGGLLRQVASVDFSWIDRVRKGKPLIICDEGEAHHQFLHADDAALAFAGAIGKKHCIGKDYILTTKDAVTWKEYHKKAMKVIGREVELVGIPLSNLEKLGIPAFDLCKSVFSRNLNFSCEKLMRDVPEFQPTMSLEAGMRQVIDEMDKRNQIPNSKDANYWEDQIIKSKKAGKPLKKVKKPFSAKIKKILLKIKKKIKK